MWDKIDTLLTEHNVSARELSTATGISPGNISDWKTGRSKPKFESIVKVSRYFGVPLEYFVDDNGS